jgi:neutral ceramidase
VGKWAAGVVALAALVMAAPAQAGELRAGIARVDITPPTGYYMMGWVRSDAKPIGVWTRLYARVIVLERDGHKVALVAEDLNGIPGGMLEQAAKLNADRGFSEANVLDSASHTHAGPAGFYNFSTYNTVFMSAHSLTDFNLTGDLDPQLYGFMVHRLALAIRRADDDLSPAAAGWGNTTILGLTQNRSLEAHLADHGILEPFGTGSVSQDPLGYAHTIDPAVEVLRVDRFVRRRRGRRLVTRRVPAAIWSTFADHGTTVHYEFEFYGADHHASATRVVEEALRRAGAPNAVNVYGNSDEGDITAGIAHNGPAWADYVGRVEAAAMLRAWRAAAGSLTRTPEIDVRWTRVCFCGQETLGGRVDSRPVFGEAEFTGSEEGRGPLYDLTGVPLEGQTSPVGHDPQGHKLGASFDLGGNSTPHAVPLLALRIADRMIVSVPGEMTAEMGRRVRAAVLGAVEGSGIRVAVVSGLANEYSSYYTTPEEFERQHYEGAATLYGEFASNLLMQSLAELSGRLVHGQAAPDAYPYDPTNGISPDAAPFPSGSATGAVLDEPPGLVRRLDHPTFSWQGGPRGFDRPLDSPFVSLQRLGGGRRPAWRTVDSDLGTHVLWAVDEGGAYRAEWEPGIDVPRGTYRFLVTANRYMLASQPFGLEPANTLTVRAVPAPAGRFAVQLAYPVAQTNVDLGYRPDLASGGRVTFTVGGRQVTVRSARGTTFSVAVPHGASATVAPRAGHDRWDNRNYQSP